MSALRTPFPYPGGKSNLADWILDQFPTDYRRYVEVFGGAASVLYRKDPSPEEVYNDLNTDLTHFFETVRDRPDDLADWLADKDYSEERFDSWADAYYAGERSDDPVERAGRFYFLRYSQFSGSIANKSGFRPAEGEASPARTWRNARSRERLEELAARFAAVEIRALDWRHVLAEYDGPETVFYLDPPYVGREHHYRCTEFAHDDLAATLADLDGRWLVSYDRLPEALADREDLFVASTDAYYTMGNGTGGGRETVEQLVCNFDPGTGARVEQTDLAAFGD
jgi:DNA adenine methylase